jgi:hypothetical protein
LTRVPPTLRRGHPAFPGGSCCSGVTTWPGLTLASTAPGTVVTCLTTAEGAYDSPATKRAGAEVRLTPTSATTKPTTAVIDATANKIRRRASARLCRTHKLFTSPLAERSGRQ